MKYILILLLLIPFNVQAEEVCDVKICNKLSRLSLDPWSHMKDSFGKECFNIMMPKSDAIVGKELNSESRWYQGSTINPTKRSVTKIEAVGACK